MDWAFTFVWGYIEVSMYSWYGDSYIEVLDVHIDVHIVVFLLAAVFVGEG